MRKLITVTLGVLVLAVGLACADNVALPLPPEDQQMITTKLGSIVGKALLSKPIEDVSVYFSLQEKAAFYQVTAGPNAGNTQRLGLAKARRPGGGWPGAFSSRPRLQGSFIRRHRVISWCLP